MPASLDRTPRHKPMIGLLAILAACQAQSQDTGVTSARLFAQAADACLLSGEGEISCQLVDDGGADLGQLHGWEGTWSTMACGTSGYFGLTSQGVAVYHGQSCETWDWCDDYRSPSGTWRSVSLFESSPCGIATDGTLQCWGNPASGPMLSLSGSWAAVATYGYSACGLSTDGQLYCETTEDSGAYAGWPTAGVWASVAGAWGNACATTEDGAITCWGDTRTGVRDDVPVGSGFHNLAIGGFHACALDANDEVVCWSGTEGALRESPPSGTFVEIAGGRFHTCGLRADGTVECWNCVGEGDEYCEWGTPAPEWDPTPPP